MGLQSVTKQLVHCFGDVIRIKTYGRKLFIDNEFDRDISISFRTDLSHDTVQQLGKIEQTDVGDGRLGYVSQGSDHVAEVMRLLYDLLCHDFEFGILRSPGQQLRPPGDDRQRIVHLVGGAGRQLPQRCQGLGSSQSIAGFGQSSISLCKLLSKSPGRLVLGGGVNGSAPGTKQRLEGLALLVSIEASVMQQGCCDVRVTGQGKNPRLELIAAL